MAWVVQGRRIARRQLGLRSDALGLRARRGHVVDDGCEGGGSALGVVAAEDVVKLKR